MNLHGWINAYLDHLRGERGLAKNTVQAYSLDLAALAAHLGEGPGPGYNPYERDRIASGEQRRSRTLGQV